VWHGSGNVVQSPVIRFIELFLFHQYLHSEAIMWLKLVLGTFIYSFIHSFIHCMNEHSSIIDVHSLLINLVLLFLEFSFRNEIVVNVDFFIRATILIVESHYYSRNYIFLVYCGNCVHIDSYYIRILFTSHHTRAKCQYTS